MTSSRTATVSSLAERTRDRCSSNRAGNLIYKAHKSHISWSTMYCTFSQQQLYSFFCGKWAAGCIKSLRWLPRFSTSMLSLSLCSFPSRHSKIRGSWNWMSCNSSRLLDIHTTRGRSPEITSCRVRGWWFPWFNSTLSWLKKQEICNTSYERW